MKYRTGPAIKHEISIHFFLYDRIITSHPSIDKVMKNPCTIDLNWKYSGSKYWGCTKYSVPPVSSGPRVKIRVAVQESCLKKIVEVLIAQ